MRRARTTKACGILLWAALSGAAAAAPVVTEIRVRALGPGPTDESFVRAHIGSETGRELDRQRLARDVRALLDTGAFADVTAEAETAGEGVCLVYTLRNKSVLAADPAVEGVSWFRARQVRKLIRLRAGDRVDEDDLAAVAARIREDYGRKHYPRAAVTWESVPVDPDEGTLRAAFAVDEQDADRVRRVRFEGCRAVPAEDLWKAVEPRRWWNPARWFKKRRYDVDELEEARAAVRDVYLDRGYLDAEVDVAVMEHDAGDRLTAVFRVREGALYRFGAVALAGVSSLPENQVRRRVAMRPGEPASAAAARRTVADVEEYYGAHGYVEALVAPALDPDPESRLVAARVDVTEGDLFCVRNIRVRGNHRTRDKVIRREILLYPGDVFDAGRARRSERIINNLGFFSRVRAYPADTPEPGKKDLIIDVEEKRTGQFMIGAGFSSEDKLIGFAELSQGNFDLTGWPYFMGAGQKIKLRAQVGERRKLYDFSFVEPWFLDRRLSLQFDAYRSETDYLEYDVQRTGGAIGLGRALPLASRLDVSYRLEHVRLTGRSDTNAYVYAEPPRDPYVFEAEEDRIASSVDLSLTHDRRDNPFVPTRGAKAKLFGSVSGGPLGFDTDIYVLGATLNQYVPLWWGHVISLRARYEIVDAYGDTPEVPLADRLFLGGGRTLRGFAWRDVGPKVVPADGGGPHRSVGGGSLAFASVEYAVPIVEHVRLAAFYDTGNVWREPYALDPDDLAASAGVGVRLDLPGFPIRVDRAWVVEKDDALTGADPWVIWIGYDY